MQSILASSIKVVEAFLLVCYLHDGFLRTILFMKQILFFLFIFHVSFSIAQTKVSGIVVDETGGSVAFANIFFKGSTEGTITNDDGRFYLESDTDYDVLIVSFIGYESQEITLASKVNYEMKITMLEAAEQLNEVILISGKQSKKNNPAVDILRKIWSKKRENGVRKFIRSTF